MNRILVVDPERFLPSAERTSDPEAERTTVHEIHSNGASPRRSAAGAVHPDACFRALAQELATGVVLLDADGEVRFANRGARTLLGLPEDVDPEHELHAVARRLPAQVRGQGTADGRDRADGTWKSLESEGGRRLSARLVPVDPASLEVAATGPMNGGQMNGGQMNGGQNGARSQNGAGSPYRVLMLRDAARGDAEESSLVLASRMRTVSFLRKQVHDLKAPLNALALNLEILRQGHEGDEPMPAETKVENRRILRTLQAEIGRLGRGLDQLVRRTTWRPESGRGFEARNFVRDTSRFVQAEARRSGVRVEVRVGKERLRCAADPDRVKQAYLNIVMNALEALPRGGNVVLRAEPFSGADGERVLLCVDDDGPGIPKQLRESIFRLHFTTKRGGTGIGLTVARSLVEAQGGELLLESSPGSGTRVTLSLPAA